MKPVIMVVDDDVLQLENTMDALEHHGARVVAHLRAEDALRDLELGIAPSLILSDLEMPGTHGDAFCMVCREKWPHIPFVLVSANVLVHSRGAEVGATQTLLKPFPRGFLQSLAQNGFPLV